ncbi:unnamed protein product [Caenorhabditis sp. 36 PRJEB53466]|nr:unnamed protein product [Caenorhabditis sp. 36 PRJEB53466]
MGTSTACDEGEQSQNLVLFDHEAASRVDAPMALPSGKKVLLTSLVNLDDTSKWTSKKVETSIERAVIAVSHKIASCDRFTSIYCAPESGRSTRYVPMKPGFFTHFAYVLTVGFGIDDTVINKTSLISTITSTTRNFLNRMRKKKQQVVDELLAEFREETKNNRADDDNHQRVYVQDAHDREVYGELGRFDVDNEVYYEEMEGEGMEGQEMEGENMEGENMEREEMEDDETQR